MRVYQLVLALKAPNFGIIVCADLAVRRSLYTHETVGRSVWDWLHNGDVHEDSPVSSLLSFTGLRYRIRSRFRDFGAPNFLGEVFTKGDTWGVPGPNSKKL